MFICRNISLEFGMLGLLFLVLQCQCLGFLGDVIEYRPFYVGSLVYSEGRKRKLVAQAHVL